MKSGWVVVITFILVACFVGNVHAEDPIPTDTPTLTPFPTETPTPTITVTPSYLEAVTLPSTGNTLIIEKRITYGEIAIVIVGLMLLGILLIVGFLVIPRLWP